MSSDKTPVEIEIRKLRKKLRQIENLETCDRHLTDDEKNKVYGKYEIRSHLLEVLSTHSEDKNELSINTSDDSQVDGLELHSVHTEPTLEVSHTESNEREAINTSIVSAEATNEEAISLPKSAETAKDGKINIVKSSKAAGDNFSSVRNSINARTSSEERQIPIDTPTSQSDEFNPAPAKKSKTILTEASSSAGTSNKKVEKSKSKKNLKRKNKEFTVRKLEGHNDMVCAVCISGDHILSGSRDTTVKLWDGLLGVELRSLGGHSDTITSVLLLQEVDAHILSSCIEGTDKTEMVGISGSKDCTLRFWNLDAGECMKSIYTYNAISCMAFLTISQQAYVIVGSEGGKVEVWDVKAENIFTSVRAHEDAITGVQVDASLIYTSSALGVIKIYQLRADETLYPVYESELVRMATGEALLQKPIHCLSCANNRLYYGDEGMSIKVLDWKSGLVHKLSHHSGDFGFTDGLCCVGEDLVLASGYDLDNGIGYVNVWTCYDDQYAYTLCDEDTGRIMCVHACLSKDGRVTMVTGGMQLKLWREHSPKQCRSQTDDEIVDSQFIPQFDRPARHSDTESNSGMTDSDEDEACHDPPLPWQHKTNGEEPKGWFTWCSIL